MDDDYRLDLNNENGFIYNNDKLVSITLSSIRKYNNTQIDSIEQYFETCDLKKHRFFNLHEGTFIRCFYTGDDWIIATDQKINAFEHRWSSKNSFGEMFRRGIIREFFNGNILQNVETFKLLTFDSPDSDINAVFEAFIDSLDKSHQHIFLVRHNFDNYIVCDPVDSLSKSVFYVCTFIGQQLEYHDIGISSLEECTTIEKPQDIINHIGFMDPFQLQGVLALSSDFPYGVKVVNVDYEQYYNVRNNEPSIRYRYLELRSDSDAVDKLCYMYPHYVSKFDHIEYMLSIISNTLYKAYVDKYIKRKHTIVSKEEYKIIKDCFEWYNSDTRRRVSRRVIMKFLNKQNNQFLNTLIKKYINNA